MNESKLFHLGFDRSEHLGRVAILPGDPDRVEIIADRLCDARQIARNREYNTWAGEVQGHPVLVCSTGIGGPSSAIAVEELHMAGVDTFIRLGTCGGMQPCVEPGDFIIATAAVRHEGTSLHYAPIEYPAIADINVVNALLQSAGKLDCRYHVGVVHSKDSFYGQHSPERMPVGKTLTYQWEAMKRLRVLGSEMECAAIFTVAASLGARAGCILSAVWNQETGGTGKPAQDLSQAIDCVLNSIPALY